MNPPFRWHASGTQKCSFRPTLLVEARFGSVRSAHRAKTLWHRGVSTTRLPGSIVAKPLLMLQKTKTKRGASQRAPDYHTVRLRRIFLGVPFQASLIIG